MQARIVEISNFANRNRGQKANSLKKFFENSHRDKHLIFPKSVNGNANGETTIALEPTAMQGRPDASPRIWQVFVQFYGKFLHFFANPYFYMLFNF